MARSIDTKYATTPEEQVFGIDPFQAVANSTLNNIVSKDKSFGSSLTNLLGVAGDVATTAGIVSMVTTGKLDKDYIINKLGNTLKIDTSFLSNTQISNAGQLLKSVGLIDDSTANLLSGKDSSMSLIDIYTNVHNGYKTTVNNVDKILDNDVFDSFSNFTNALAAINPTAASMISTMGLSEELGLLNNIVSQTISLNIPGIIDTIINDITDDRTQKKVLASSIPDALVAGNVELIEIALDKLGSNSVLSMYPNIVKLLLANYKGYDSDINQSDTVKANKLLTLLNKISSNWYKYNRNGIWIIDLDVFSEANVLVRTILTSDMSTEYASAISLADQFKKNDVMTIAKKYYPHI